MYHISTSTLPSLREFLCCCAFCKNDKDGGKSKDDDDDDDDDDKKKEKKPWFGGRKRAESLANSEADTYGEFISSSVLVTRLVLLLLLLFFTRHCLGRIDSNTYSFCFAFSFLSTSFKFT